MFAERHDGQILDASSPVVRALLQISALAWWRSVPAEAFRAAEYLEVCSGLQEVAGMVEGAEFERALQGDANAAIALALSLGPIKRLGGIKTDIAMTAVLSIALEGEPRCAPLLAHVIDRPEPDPRRADQLCGSWLEFHFGCSPWRGGLAAEQAMLLKALRDFDARASEGNADLQFADTGGTVLT